MIALIKPYPQPRISWDLRLENARILCFIILNLREIRFYAERISISCKKS
jgi:hypothetical protein